MNQSEITPMKPAKVEVDAALVRGLVDDVRNLVPTVHVDRDDKGEIAGITKIGDPDLEDVPWRKFFTYDEKGRIKSFVSIPVVDPVDRLALALYAKTAHQIRATAGAAMVTIDDSLLSSLPRYTNLEAIRVAYEREASLMSGKPVTLKIHGPCEQMANLAYAHSSRALDALKDGETCTVTLNPEHYPELNTTRIADALAVLIATKHPEKAARVEIRVGRTTPTTDTPPATAPAKHPAGFSP